MNSFKVWLELTQGSDPMRDVSPTQTNQATQTVAQDITQSPRFANFQSKILRQQGSPSAAQKTLVNGATKLMNMNAIVPPQIASQTDVPKVTFALQNMMGQKLNIPKPVV